ncbi:HAD family hydrolase [Lysinibacillus alkalisoli]|nr:HAD family hydrolase [Lysinibacillus alkalisoli]
MNFVFDLDGTICFKGQPLTTAITDSLQALQQAGHTIIIASARPIRDIYPVIPTWMQDLSMIGGNGAIVKQQDTTEVEAFSCLQDLQNLINDYELTYLADSSWDYAFTGDEEHSLWKNIDVWQVATRRADLTALSEVVKLILFTIDDHIVEQLRHLPVEINIHHGENILDISPQGVTKYQGLQKLGITEFIAFGNDANDISLFNMALESICVGEHEVGDLATYRVTAQQVAAKIQSYL